MKHVGARARRWEKKDDKSEKSVESEEKRILRDSDCSCSGDELNTRAIVPKTIKMRNRNKNKPKRARLEGWRLVLGSSYMLVIRYKVAVLDCAG